MFSILDGREKFYQWDKDRKLIVFDETITQVHFANCLCPSARVCEVYAVDGIHLVDVPNVLLQEHMDIRVWGYDGEMTKHEAEFEVEKRTKPDDYVYTETELWTAEKAVEEALEEAKANGDFKGDKGDKGEAGVINFVVVSELPETGSGDSIYLLPNTIGENNQFDEYIYHNEAWEKIGSAGVEVNLDEYVKKTDYASTDVAGVIKVHKTANNGLVMANDGELCVYPCNLADIDAKKQNRKPITPYTLDYAVKSGMTTNALEWTDDEKKAARALIGADLATSTTPGIVGVNVANYGIGVNTAGVLYIDAATEAQIDAKTNTRRPIVPSTVDYAVKKGLADSKEEWTDDEKAAAREQLGAAGTELATYNKPGLLLNTSTYNGLFFHTDGSLNIWPAATNHIDDRVSRCPITPTNLDYAIRMGITTNEYTLTDVEKRDACNWLGATDNTPYDFDETYVIAEEDINEKGEYHRYTDSQGNPISLSEMLVDFTVPPGANTGNAYLYFRYGDEGSTDETHMRVSEFPYQHASGVRHTKNLCYKLRDGFYDIKCYGWTDGENYTALQFTNGARMNCGPFLANPTPMTGFYFNVGNGKAVVGTEIRVRGRRV